MLKVQGWLAVVVGGGKVGLHKARLLRDAGAEVKLIAPRLVEETDLAGITVIRQPYTAEHLIGANLVFACTNERQLNTQVALDAQRIGALVNVADQPEDSDFFVPAVITEGDVLVTVSTGGVAPALSAELKRRIAGSLPDEIGDFADLLGRLRKKVKTEVKDSQHRGRIMKHLAAEATFELFLKDGAGAVELKLEDLIGGL